MKTFTQLSYPFITHVFFLGLLSMMLFAQPLQAQEYVKLSAEFSSKESLGDSSVNLTMGSILYDLKERKIQYSIRVPQEETWIFSDSIYLLIKADSIIKEKSSPDLIDLSLFNQILSSEFHDYKLPDSLYEKIATEKEDGLIISTWRPTEKLAHLAGPIMVAKKGRLLQGIVYLNAQKEVVSKEIYENYDYSSHIPFPQKMTQILYKDGKTIYKETNFRHVKFNSDVEEEFFDYSHIE